MGEGKIAGAKNEECQVVYERKGRLVSLLEDAIFASRKSVTNSPAFEPESLYIINYIITRMRM